MKAVGRAGTGVNNIPVEAMSKRGIPVFNAPGANANRGEGTRDRGDTACRPQRPFPPSRT